MTKSPAWEMSETDRYAAQEAYIGYAAGISVISEPERLDWLHGRDSSQPTEQEEILRYAQGLIWAGLSDIIRYANPPEFRSPLAHAEKRFAEAHPNMVDTVRRVYKTQTSRLEWLPGALDLLCPLPIATNEEIYRTVAHSRRHKLRLHQVMGGLAFAQPFDNESAQNRNFTAIGPRHRSGARDPRLKVVKNH